jgi:hypothetical protein
MWIRVEETDGMQRPGARSVLQGPPSVSGGSWLQFGRETLFYSAGEQAPVPALSSDPHGRAAWRQTPATPEGLHVVVQHGRRFQQHHPDVPVLHDRGRFLLVQLDPEDAGRLSELPETCYKVFPAAPEMVVFQVRARAAAPERDPVVAAATERLTVPQARATLEHLADLHTRHSTSSGFTHAATFASEQLRRMGYLVTTAPVPVGSRQSLNVVADKAGSGPPPRNLVIVTAHLDSINVTGGPGAIAPGADDNASGSAGVLEMARAFQTHGTQHDLRFILFGGEEQGLLGSRQYVTGLTASECGRILAVVNMDMIGSMNRTSRSVLLEGAPVSQSVIDGLFEAAATYTTLTVETSLHPANSDHVPFIDASIPAVLTIEGADSTNHRVHSAADTVEAIDYDLLLDVLRMNVAFVAAVAGSTSPAEH